MVATPTPRPRIARSPYLWLATALVLSLFAGGRTVVPIAAWLAPIPALRFMRTVRRAWLGYALLVLVGVATMLVAWRGTIPMQPPANVVLIAANSLVSGVPYVVDRVLHRRLAGWWATLPFPLALTALEFANMGSGSPMGSFGATVYSQAGQVVLLQILSITGIWGPTFLMAWLAPVASWAWEDGFAWPTLRRAGLVYGGVLAAVLIHGGARLTFAPKAPGSVRVASMTAESIDFERLMPLREADPAAFAAATRAIQDRYFERTVAEARAGARIVLWPEGAATGLEADEPALLARGAEVAAAEAIYLAMPLFTLYDDPARPPENKLIVFDPAGGNVLEHVKFGGNIVEGSLKGDGILKTVETPHGTLSGVICWDTDFIRNMAQAGRNGTDILLSPAHDWPALDPLHGQMSAFRAIENGISVVRHADLGWSVITDPYGRTLASMDHFASTDRTMVAQVPTSGVRTVYSVIGDLFGWLAVAGLAVVAGMGWMGGRSSNAVVYNAADTAS